MGKWQGYHDIMVLLIHHPRPTSLQDAASFQDKEIIVLKGALKSALRNSSIVHLTWPMRQNHKPPCHPLINRQPTLKDHDSRICRILFNSQHPPKKKENKKKRQERTTYLYALKWIGKLETLRLQALGMRTKKFLDS